MTDTLQARLREIGERHKREVVQGWTHEICLECNRGRWPCDAAKLVDVADKADWLLKRLDDVHADPAYQSVWTLNQLHGGEYRGPRYSDQLTALREALASIEEKVGG